MRLIDADKVIQEYKECAITVSEKAFVHIFEMWLEDVDEVDAVPVVRCKGCKHFEQFRPHDGFCTIDGMLNNNDHFCSYGERKGGVNDAAD